MAGGIQDGFPEMSAPEMSTAESWDRDEPVIAARAPEEIRDASRPSHRNRAQVGGQSRTKSVPGIDPRDTFDAFVIGSSNRFAHAAALSVAEDPGHNYNPLFIHGHAGLGKTHLLHAIGNYVCSNFPRHRVKYITTEAFMNEFVYAIRSQLDTWSSSAVTARSATSC